MPSRLRVLALLPAALWALAATAVPASAGEASQAPAGEAAPAAARRTFDVREGTLTYDLVHKLHRVRGTSREVEGRAVVEPDGSAKVQVRAKVVTFDSGNSNRDVQMRAVTKAPEHPYVTVKGTLADVRFPLTAGERPLKATVELAGKKQAVTIPATLSPEGDRLRAKFSFPISLDAFGIERPELLMIKVDDRVVIEGNLLFEAAK
jgi:YceI-like domain